MEIYRTISAALVVAGMCAAPGLAFAESSNGVEETAEMQSLNTVKLTAVQAAQAAETKIGGKASSVQFQQPKAGSPDAFYHVEVASADGVQHDVAVDANSGEIMKFVSAEDGQDGEKRIEGNNHEEEND